MRQPYRTSLLAWFVVAASASAAPTVSITSPVNLQLSNVYWSQAGSDDVPVLGSVGGTNLRDWTLRYKPNASSSWTTIATGTGPASGTLGIWSTLDRPDGTFNANGLYNLQLFACDTSSNCSFSTTVNDTLSNFSLTQSTPSGQPELANGQVITYSSIVPWALTVTLSIKNLSGAIVKSAGTTTSGSTTWQYQWNGTNTAGVRVPDGPYFVSVGMTDGTNSFTWDQTNQYLGAGPWFEYIDEPDFDPFNNDPLPITYTFGVGRVTIAVAAPGIDEIETSCQAPGVFCVLDHKYQESGTHTIHWPGVDSTGKFRPDVGSMAILSDHLTFSKNAVVLYGTKPTVSNVTVNPPVAWSGASQFVQFTLTIPTPLASCQLKFLNQESLTVLRTLTSVNCIGGTLCTAIWDGKADNGMLVAPGAYTITVTATDTIGNVASAQALAFIQF